MRRIALFLLVSLSAQAADVGLLRASIATLHKGGPAAAQEAQPGSPTDRVVTTMPQVEAPGTPWRARFMAAEWLLMAHQERLRMSPVPEVTQSQRDLEMAWNFVRSAYEASQGVQQRTRGFEVYRGENATSRVASTKDLGDRVKVEDVPEALRAAVVSVALEIAVRLNRADAMGLAASYAQKLPTLSTRDKTFALMGALHGGSWTEALRWSKELEGTKVLGALHQAALSDAERFDYAAVAGLALPKAVAAPLTPTLERREVRDLRLRLVSARGPEALVQALKGSFGASWQSSGPMPSPFLRLGAAAHWLKPGARPVPLTGFATVEGFELRGFVELASGRQRVETLSLHRDPTRADVWAGRMVAVQGTATEELVAEFDAECLLGPAKP